MEDYSKIRGFNYQPSYGTTSLENWLYFNPDLFELELRRGKAFFPRFSVVRLWLPLHAYMFNPKKFLTDFETALKICERLQLRAVVCLFNRWADNHQDNGGIPLDYILPGMRYHDWSVPMDAYVTDVVTAHSGDERILIWDICNEPCSYKVTEETRPIYEIEIQWLKRYSDMVHKLDGKTPVGNGLLEIQRIAEFSDVLLVHPYFAVDKEGIFNPEKRRQFAEEVDALCDLSKELDKPMLATETCWGAYTDEDRVDIIKFNLETLASHNLGFLAHALHYSLVPDLHNLEDGPLGAPGNLAFTNKDGTLRKGHEVFNDY